MKRALQATFRPMSHQGCWHVPYGDVEETLGCESQQDHALAEFVLGWIFHEMASQGNRMQVSSRRQADSGVAFNRPVKRRNVLIAEDDSCMRQLLKELVATLGYQPICAETGLQALGQITGNQIDLVISDIHMPGISGIELLKRAKEQVPEIPVLLITGDASAVGHSAEVRQADGLIPKPFFIEDLCQSLERFLGPARHNGPPK